MKRKTRNDDSATSLVNALMSAIGAANGNPSVDGIDAGPAQGDATINWEEGYRPAGRKEEYSPTDWEQEYNGIYSAQLAALDAAYLAQKARQEAQLPEIGQAYDEQRNRAYANARQLALAENEALAAQGLAGNAYAGPLSGASETARIFAGNALASALNAANRKQRSAEEAVGQNITEAGFKRDQEAADLASAIRKSILEQSQDEKRYVESLRQRREQDEYERAADEKDMLRQSEQTAYQRKRDALQQAYDELLTFGRIVTQAAADALGYRIGTRIGEIRK